MLTLLKTLYNINIEVEKRLAKNGNTYYKVYNLDKKANQHDADVYGGGGNIDTKYHKKHVFRVHEGFDSACLFLNLDGSIGIAHQTYEYLKVLRGKSAGETWIRYVKGKSALKVKLTKNKKLQVLKMNWRKRKRFPIIHSSKDQNKDIGETIAIYARNIVGHDYSYPRDNVKIAVNEMSYKILSRVMLDIIKEPLNKLKETAVKSENNLF